MPKNYEYLLAYKITVPIYDLTVKFCKMYISFDSRTKDQMTQAARSGMQNILEGASQKSLAGYIKLCGVARGSLEELLNDYKSYARQSKISLLKLEEAKGRIREIEEIWKIIKKEKVLPDSPNFPNLPDKPVDTINLMITLINQANYLLDNLIKSLIEKHKTEGGFNENLLKERKRFRGY
jgi:four helix bundle suffix protein